MTLNEDLGRSVSTLVHQMAKPQECVKFNLHVEEIEKITNLLLVLSGRLARTENSLAVMPEQGRTEEKAVSYTHLTLPTNREV